MIRPGDTVRLKGKTEQARVIRYGTLTERCFQVDPPLDGLPWHTEDDVEVVS